MLPLLWLLLATFALLLAFLWLFQRRLIYFPLSSSVPPAKSILAQAEDVTFPTEDGLQLSGWFVGAPQPSHGTVLVLNGNAGDRSFRAPLAEALANKGLSVLLFDYR